MRIAPSPQKRSLVVAWAKMWIGATAMLALSAMLAQITLAQPVTSVEIVEKAGQTTANYPMTLSMVFKQGDVGSNVTANLGGTNLTTQTDVKARYADNSIKHALVSFSIPQVQASQSLQIDILSGGANANNSYMTRSQLEATDFDASVGFNNFTNGASSGTVTARNLLASAVTPDYWMQGDVATEFLIRDYDTNVNSQLNVQYNVRKYAGWNGYRVDTVVENTRTDGRGNLKYDVDLQFGLSSPVTALSETGLKHNFDSRWHQVEWFGQEPPEVEIRYDVDYLASTGAIPQYDTSLVVPEATIASEYAAWLASPDRGLVDTGTNMSGKRGLVTRYFPATGGRQEIGLYPTWAARYLLTMDNRMKEIMLNSADIAGSIPIHLREADPTKPSLGTILNIDDRPTLYNRAGQENYWATTPEDKLPNPVGSIESGCSGDGACWAPDGAHQASFAYLPYLFTGDQYYKEEMYYWASWNLSYTNPGYRDYEKGWLSDQSRGEAWIIRNIADAAFLAPDADTLVKAYLTDKVEQNIEHWKDEYLNSASPYYRGPFPSVRYWWTINPDSLMDPEITAVDSPWMTDFVNIVLLNMKRQGYDTSELADWLGESIINRFTHPDTNPYRGAPYRIPVEDANGPLATWQEVNDGYVDNVGPTDFPTNDYPFSYNYIARSVLSQLTHLPGGQEAFDWLDSRLYNKDQLAQDPTWAFLATMAPLFGDFDTDGDVDGDDLDIWSLGFGTDASGDADEDGDTDGFDFLIWQKNFTETQAAANSVPEPSSLGLFLLGTLWICCPPRRRRHR